VPFENRLGLRRGRGGPVFLYSPCLVLVVPLQTRPPPSRMSRVPALWAQVAVKHVEYDKEGNGKTLMGTNCSNTGQERTRSVNKAR